MFWSAGSVSNYLGEKTWNNEDSEVEDERIWDVGEGIAVDGESK